MEKLSASLLTRCTRDILKSMLDYLHHLFFPRDSNNHRARLLHHEVIALCVLVLFVGQFLFVSVKRHFPDVLGLSTDFSIERLVELTNEKRSHEGLEPLMLDSNLSEAATFKASDMLTKNYWAHYGPDGTSPWVFFKKVGYDYQYAGENLARGFTSPEDVVDAWMASPTHRENMLSPKYSDIGFAIQEGTLLGEQTTLVVEHFGAKPLSSFAKRSASAKEQVPAAKETQAQGASRVFAVSESRNPLIDSVKASANISFLILGLFIFVLLSDMIIIKRKNIIRVVGHNADHIFFLAGVALFVAFFIRGVIL